MDDFSVLEQLCDEISKDTDTKPDNSKKDSCEHLQVIEENGIKLCTDCGAEIHRNINHDKEWRYYGSADTRHNSDPSRCHIRKSEEKNICKDVEGMGFNVKIISDANTLYELVTNGKIYRGNSRKAIVFACIFHSYKKAKNPQSCDTLVKIFNLEKKIGLRGLKHVSLYGPKDPEMRTSYIKPQDIIGEIMEKFDADEEHKNEVIKIYESIRNKSSIINRSRPQSVASGVVRYYILLTHKDISMNDFKSTVGLSELTITRIVREISQILNTPHIS